MHCQVERLIVIVCGAEKPADGYVYAQLFLDFALEGSLWSFSWFNFSSWELPHPFKFAISALSGKVSTVTLYYGRNEALASVGRTREEVANCFW